MSLYYESSRFLETHTIANESLKSQVYGTVGLKSKPAHVYAVVSEATKWSTVLSEIIEKVGILKLERKLTPALSLLLAHDLLLSKHGVAAPREHALRLAIERHKARLNAELAKCRLKAGFATVQAWKSAIESDVAEETDEDDQQFERWKHPRWIRINTLKSALDNELSGTLADFEIIEKLQDVLRSPTQRKCLVRDEHIPNLVAVPSGIDLSKSPAYLNGRIIFQDKASCFPACLLDPQTTDGDIVDACAAPGNKTTHLAALMIRFANKANHRQRTLFACERDRDRSVTLEKMTHTAGADSQDQFKVTCLVKQDFLRLDPGDVRFKHVGAILLDPSCSGSGIVGRDDADAVTPAYKLVLPRPSNQLAPDSSGPQGKKRKRHQAPRNPEPAQISTVHEPETIPTENILQAHKPLPDRLDALSKFQLALLEHAFRFPAARKVVYSTCSIHPEENEHVVLRALRSTMGREGGWRVAARGEQAAGLREWAIRGDREAIADYLATRQLPGVDVDLAVDVDAVANACLRCERGTEQGTMGFFAVMFVRDDAGGASGGIGNGRDIEESVESAEEEWGGLSDSDG